MSQTPQQPQRPRLSIIIVSYNTLDLLRDCLLSILPQLGPHDEVIVVDNASSDGSADMVANHFRNTLLIASDKNLGFGRANNKGIALAKGEIIWLLNPDTRLTPAALDKAVGFMCTTVGEVSATIPRRRSWRKNSKRRCFFTGSTTPER